MGFLLIIGISVLPCTRRFFEFHECRPGSCWLQVVSQVVVIYGSQFLAPKQHCYLYQQNLWPKTGLCFSVNKCFEMFMHYFLELLLWFSRHASIRLDKM